MLKTREPLATAIAWGTDVESLESWTAPASLESRIVTTLEIANRWGYGLAEREISGLLYGGPEDDAAVVNALASSSAVTFRDGFATMKGRDELIDKCVARRSSNGKLATTYFEIAEEFAKDLLRLSPFVRSVAVCGSAASGGLEEGDDIDFNLFAEDGAKYIVYVTALLLGVKYSLRHGRRFSGGASFLGILRKVTCVNVVWRESDCRPFARQDPFLAFELLRSVPIAGTEHFAAIVRANPWLRLHFPQIFGRVHADRVPPQPLSLLARAQRNLVRSPRVRRALEAGARAIASAFHAIIRLSRGRNPEALARQAFLRRVKFPYDVFQD